MIPREVAPGLIAATITALAASYLGEHYGAPQLLFALLLGMALQPLSSDPRYKAGITFAGRTLLRLSVGLLGLRVTFDQVLALGWSTAVMVVSLVMVSIAVGLAAARVFRLDARFGVLSGGSVGICGASAAMAIAAAWPDPEGANTERDTILVIAIVTTLSTVAMVLYPPIAGTLGLSALDTGRFLGGSIHDVAQVVGAGFSVSEEVGEIATITKLMRVAMLLPVVTAIPLVVSRLGRNATGAPAAVPWFITMFVGLAVLSNVLTLPAAVLEVGNTVSRALLVASVAALGMKTSVSDLAGVGGPAIALIVVETVALATFVLGWVRWVG